jgi:hypothetical protein
MLRYKTISSLPPGLLIKIDQKAHYFLLPNKRQVATMLRYQTISSLPPGLLIKINQKAHYCIV